MTGETETTSGYRKKMDVERTYRTSIASELLNYRVAIGESDLMVLSDLDIRPEIESHLLCYRRQLKEYIYQHPDFAKTLVPYTNDPEAPEIVAWMIKSATVAGVGPMAAVAGAIAGMLGRSFTTNADLIIENGGDIFLRSTKERVISIFAGSSPFSNRLGLLINPQPSGLGICTSAGTVGPSLSFGKADAVVIISPDVALADATATAAGNLIQTVSDLEKALDFAQQIANISGVLLIKDDKMAARGCIKLVSV